MVTFELECNKYIKSSTKASCFMYIVQQMHLALSLLLYMYVIGTPRNVWVWL